MGREMLQNCAKKSKRNRKKIKKIYPSIPLDGRFVTLMVKGEYCGRDDHDDQYVKS